MTHKNEHIVTRLALTLVLLWMPATLLLAGIDRLSFRTLDVRDGLADNFVRDIFVDSEGYVWFSTINGVSSYDGYRFRNYQPQQWGGRSGDVAMVRETADGTLWMLCTGELFTFDRRLRTWRKDGQERLALTI